MINNITYASPDEANAENDSRLLRPNRVCGTRDIVTTECRRPDDVDAYLSAHPRTKRRETTVITIIVTIKNYGNFEPMAKSH